MPYLRILTARPRPDRKDEVREHYEELIRTAASNPGYLLGWVLLPHDDSGDVGIATLWETAEAASHASTTTHAMALRSEIQFDVTGQQWDRSFDAYIPEQAIAP